MFSGDKYAATEASARFSQMTASEAWHACATTEPTGHSIVLRRSRRSTMNWTSVSSLAASGVGEAAAAAALAMRNRRCDTARDATRAREPSAACEAQHSEIRMERRSVVQARQEGWVAAVRATGVSFSSFSAAQ